MGNLGRPGYGATGDGLWPYSYVAPLSSRFVPCYGPVTGISTGMTRATGVRFRIKPTMDCLGSLAHPGKIQNTIITYRGNLASDCRALKVFCERKYRADAYLNPPRTI